MEEKNEALRAAVLRNFFTAEGKLKSVPSQLKKKLIALEHLVSKLEKGRLYEEKEINAFIKEYHDDFATLRREFINIAQDTPVFYKRGRNGRSALAGMIFGVFLFSLLC